MTRCMHKSCSCRAVDYNYCHWHGGMPHVILVSVVFYADYTVRYACAETPRNYLSFWDVYRGCSLTAFNFETF